MGAPWKHARASAVIRIAVVAAMSTPSEHAVMNSVVARWVPARRDLGVSHVANSVPVILLCARLDLLAVDIKQPGSLKRVAVMQLAVLVF